MRSAKMIRFINETVQTTTHAHTVERFIITFKDNLYRILDSLKQDKTNWIKHIDNIIKSMIQLSTALLKPSLLKLVIKITIYGLTGTFKIQPKIIENTPIWPGDMVRYKLKPSIGTKSHEPKWGSTRHRIVGNPTDNQYYIPSVAVENRTAKLWRRHELLKV